MADYSTNFSFILELNNEARDRAHALYERLEQAMGIASDLDDPIHPVKGELTARAVDLADGMDEWLGFQVFLVDNGLWIRDDGDSGSPDHVSAFVQALLQMLELDTVVTFSWGDSCSKPRTDGFGGGAMAITRHAVESINTNSWCEEKSCLLDPKLGAHAAQISEYVQTLGVACPACGSDGIEGGHIEIDAGNATQVMTCNNCGSSWVDTYRLTGFTELQYGSCALCGQTVFDHGRTVREGGLFCSPSCAEAATEKEVGHG